MSNLSDKADALMIAAGEMLDDVRVTYNTLYALRDLLNETLAERPDPIGFSVLEEPAPLPPKQPTAETRKVLTTRPAKAVDIVLEDRTARGPRGAVMLPSRCALLVDHVLGNPGAVTFQVVKKKWNFLLEAQANELVEETHTLCRDVGIHLTMDDHGFLALFVDDAA